jgi:hypothetical protein
MIEARTPTSATLVERQNGTFYLHVQIDGTAPALQPTRGMLGVDLDQCRVAVDSDAIVYEATKVN